MERVSVKKEDPVSQFATRLAGEIEGMVGTHEWRGDDPYEIRMVDSKEGRGFIYKIRKGDDWITIQEQASDNPHLVRTFLLQKEGDTWTYVDGSLSKRGKSSLPELQTAYERVRIAIEASAPKPLDESRRELE